MKRKLLYISLCIVVTGTLLTACNKKKTEIAEPATVEQEETSVVEETTEEVTEKSDTTAPEIKAIEEVKEYKPDEEINPSDLVEVTDESDYKVYFVGEDGERETLSMPKEAAGEVYLTVVAIDEYDNRSDEVQVTVKIIVPEE